MTDKNLPPCPCCNGVLRIVWRLVAKDPTTLSIAGVGIKVAAVNTPHLVCDCGFINRGKK